MAKKVILVAGMIGVGKSTVVKAIEQNIEKIKRELSDEVTIFLEHLDPIWRKNFYDDREKYTKGFEFNALNGRVGRHADAKKLPGYVFFDRGILEGAMTFAYNSYKQGYFRKRNYDAYKDEICDSFDDLKRQEAQSWLESLYVNLYVKDTQILKDRTDRRAGAENLEKIPFEYLKIMNEVRYPAFMEKIVKIYEEDFAVPAPEVLHIDASVDMNLDTNYLSRTVAAIIGKIKESEKQKDS